MVSQHLPSQDDFRIGWIAALSTEAIAAKQMLDEHFDIADIEQDQSDTNIYTFGRIGSHHVVITRLPEGRDGTIAAAEVAVHMARTFSRSLRLVLVVGLGGAISPLQNDIRLGDIVVGVPNGQCPGVVQYDYGKYLDGDPFVRKGTLNDPPSAILGAVSILKEKEAVDEHQYPAFMDTVANKSPKLAKLYARPASDTDRLPAREDMKSRSHYGTIASGNAVIKSARKREMIRQETGALACDMEAAGLMKAFPTLVIRGICDYADSYKRDIWHNYAALAAAAYAKELTLCTPSYGLARHDPVNNLLAERHHVEIKDRQTTQEENLCLQSLKIGEYEEYKDIHQDAHKGTCKWVLENRQYLARRDQPQETFLVVTADPGCGKSVLAKTLIDCYFTQDHLGNVTVCHFFLKVGDQQSTISQALCAILHQLFISKPNLLQHAVKEWRRHGQSLRNEVSLLSRILSDALSDNSTGNTIVVLDGLDECREDQQERLVKLLSTMSFTAPIAATNKSWHKFLVTSRPYRRIQSILAQNFSNLSQIHLRGEEENKRIHEEINIVISWRVARLAVELGLTSLQAQQLEAQLLAFEHRTYLWLYLVVDEIRTTYLDTLRYTEEVIPRLPQSVDQAYEKILERVRDFDTAKLMLRVIVGARRPLSVEELAVVLGMATKSDGVSLSSMVLDTASLESKIRSTCGLFVFFQDSKAHLIHQTARDFLLRTQLVANRVFSWQLDQHNTSRLFARICTRYLVMLDEETPVSDHARSRRIQSQAKSKGYSLTRFAPTRPEQSIVDLFRYSASYWPDLVADTSADAQLELLAETRILHQHAAERRRSWFGVYWTTHHNDKCIQLPTKNLAALTGHVALMQAYLDERTDDIDTYDGQDRNSLVWASERGHFTLVKMLVERGAAVNAIHPYYGSAVNVALSKGFEQIALYLVRAGADIHKQCKYSGDTFHIAALAGADDTVKEILSMGYNIDTINGELGTALEAAASRGHISTIRLLLERHAQVNISVGEYRCALGAASYGNHRQAINILIRAGASLSNYKLLEYVITNCSASILLYLFKHGLDIEPSSDETKKASDLALERRAHNMIEMLLLEGATPGLEWKSSDLEEFRHQLWYRDLCQVLSLPVSPVRTQTLSNMEKGGGYLESTIEDLR
ncbi:hypothetical protein KVT40_007848 [Elsinoe batatas]|uniref:Uncharacterized protein n=1 Tax=Elsinoe batatas TaxID=2601811 RepID=A0A8K0PCN7_9PEZI|nr:hypothetical protein KVT40_007848 [Elsinoe batatas]